MRKIGGILLLSVIALSACSAPAPVPPGVAAESQAPAGKMAPLVAAPPVAAPAVTLPPVYADATAREKFLVGVKKNWRGSDLPADDTLINRGAESCALFDQGLTMGEIGERGGSTEVEWDNAGAIAVYASRVFCTEHNTDNL